MPYFFPIYNATAIAKAKPADAAPTGSPEPSKYTDLLAGIVQNTSSVLEPPELKFILLVSPAELLKTVSLCKVVEAERVPKPTSKLLVPCSKIV